MSKHITFDCIHCGQSLIVDAIEAGEGVRCAVCSRVVRTPMPEEIKRMRPMKAEVIKEGWSVSTVIYLIIALVVCGYSLGILKPSKGEALWVEGASRMQYAK